jgi:hypothetical protein
MNPQASSTRVRVQKGRPLVKRGETRYVESRERSLQERRSVGASDLQEPTRRAAEGGEPVPNPFLKIYAPRRDWTPLPSAPFSYN